MSTVTSSPRKHPFASADEVNTACYNAIRAVKAGTGRRIGGKGRTPSRDEDFGPDGWARVGTLWTMDDPGLQWGVWLNLGSGHGVAWREPFDPALRDRYRRQPEPRSNPGVRTWMRTEL